MAFNNEYPYVDPNRHNSDWLLHEMKTTRETVDLLKNQLQNEVKTLMIEFLNEILPDVVYDESNERIVLFFENVEVVADAVHYYDKSTNTMVIEKEV